MLLHPDRRVYVGFVGGYNYLLTSICFVTNWFSKIWSLLFISSRWLLALLLYLR